jgi:hypothetical protein
MIGLTMFGRGEIAGTTQPWLSKIAARTRHQSGKRNNYALLEQHPCAEYPSLASSWMGKESQTPKGITDIFAVCVSLP